MMKRSNRGMAKVSVVWMIVILMFGLAGWVWSFLNGGELEVQRAEVVKVTRERDDMAERNRKAAEEIVALSQVIGYSPDGSSRTELTALKEGFANLRTSFPDIDASTKNFQAAIPTLVQTVAAAKEREATAAAQSKTWSAEVEQARANIKEVAETKDKEIASLRSQLADVEGQKSDMEQKLNNDLAAAREQTKDRDSKWRATETAMAEASRKYAQEAESLRTRMGEMGRKLMPFVKEPEQSDGHVLSVSKDLGLGWINLGAKHRLPVGTRFHVVSGAKGSERIKSMAEVTKVEGEMAEVTFSDQRDPFDPPVSGDVIYNPVYDPRGERHAMLIGEFSGPYSRTQLEGLLGGMGVKIKNKFDNSIDFLVVGSEMYTDENKQPVAEPISPTDLPAYKEAVAQGTQVVLLKDLRAYFRF